MIKNFLTCVLCIISLLFAPFANAETKNECIDNSDFLGYSTTIASICGYEPNKKFSEATALISKECVATYGNKLVFNATMAAVHEVKAKIAEQGRSKVCADVYKELDWYFE